MLIFRSSNDDLRSWQLLPKTALAHLLYYKKLDAALDKIDDDAYRFSGCSN